MLQQENIFEAARRSARMHVVAGLTVIFLMLGGIAVWAARTEIAGAVLVSGSPSGVSMSVHRLKNVT